MGYRSTIYIKCAKKLESKLVAILSEHGFTGDYRFTKIDEDNDFVKFVANDLKWYNGYKDVEAVESFVIDNYENCGLLGIGEDGAESARVGDTDELEMWTVTNIEW